MAENARPAAMDRRFATPGRIVRPTRARPREKLDLPSPPPDPWLDSSNCRGNAQGRAEDEDFIAYLSNLGTAGYENRARSDMRQECASRNSNTSTTPADNSVPEEAFAHLDRLYALAEQILVIRSHGSKLFKRVRDLEKKKVLSRADREAERAVLNNDYPISDLPDEDAGFAESLLDAILANGREPQSPRRSLRSPSYRRRSRSLGLTEPPPLPPRVINPSLRAELEKSRNDSGGPKVSKWTRVKAAFRWERACTNDLLETLEPVATPASPTSIKFLKIPETVGSWSCSTLSPATSEISGPSTPVGRISPASSSNDEVFDNRRKNGSSSSDGPAGRTIAQKRTDDANRRSRSLDDDATTVTNRTDPDDEQVNNGNPQIRVIPENVSDHSDHSSQRSSLKDQDRKRPTPILTITIPSNEEDSRCLSSPESISPFPSSVLDSGECSPQRPKSNPETSSAGEYKRQRSATEENNQPRPKMQRQDSKWNKVRRAFLTNSTSTSVPPSPVRTTRPSFLNEDTETPKVLSCSGSVEDLEKMSSSNAQTETRRDYQALREKLGAEFHRKLVEWERLKSSNQSRGARGSIHGFNGGSDYRASPLLNEDQLAPEFKRKLQEWKRAKKGRRSSASIEQNRVSRRRLTDWQLWRSPLKPESRSHENGPRGSCASVGSAGSGGSDGKSHMCEDFVKRLEAWRRINDFASRTAEGVKNSIDETEFLALDRLLPIFGSSTNKDQASDDRMRANPLSDTDIRTQESGNEILIRTSIGSYRFEGISREFTRKLYDWEKHRGISPRSSTFRLLGPTYAALAREMNNENCSKSTNNLTDDEGYFGGLKRSKSMSSMQESLREDTILRRSTSLQSLNRLEDKLCDSDRANTSSAPIDGQHTEDVSEDAAMDDSEPEAMIVDIEDVIEETASPLARVQPHQTPVYSVAASETTSIAVPLGTVTSSHEPSPVILVEIEDNARRAYWNREIDCSSPDEDSAQSDNSSTFVWNRKLLIKQDFNEESANEALDIVNSELVLQEESSSTPNDEEKASYDSPDKSDSVKYPTQDPVSTEQLMDLPSESVTLACVESEPDSEPEYRPSNEESCKDETDRLKNQSENEKSEDTCYLRQVIEIASPIPTEFKAGILKISNDFETVAEFVADIENTYGTLSYHTDREIEDGASYFKNHASERCSVREHRRREYSPLETNSRRSTVGQWQSENDESDIYERSPIFDRRESTSETERSSNFEDLSLTSTSSAYQFHEENAESLTSEIRRFERIIINEETLNKIIVPTASHESPSSSTARTRSLYDPNLEAANSNSEDSRRSSREDRTSESTKSDRSSSSKKSKRTESRNVFVKTKRMIFSPFKRTDDWFSFKKDSSSEGKSRSASPKVSRQEAFHRMQLPLLWPLGLGLRSPDSSDESAKKRRSWGEDSIRVHQRQPDFSSLQPSRNDRTGTKYHSKKSPDSPTVKFDCPPSRSISTSTLKEDEEFENLSSDLVHKLKILSNAAARKDGRSESEESRPGRFRRVKEGLLSRRGGAYCLSMLETGESSKTVETGNGGATSSENSPVACSAKAQLQERNSSREVSNSRPDLIKSASVGMINVDPDGKSATSDRGCESLPRTISKRREPSGPLARIATRLGLSRLVRHRDCDYTRMNAVSTLCRQSLFLDARSSLDERRPDDHPRRSRRENGS